MEYREIEALSLDEAKFRIKKEYGDRARIIKIVETYSGGFLGIGKKKKVKVLISISDIDLLKKYKENMRISDVYSKNSEKSDLVPRNITDEITMSVLLEKLNRIESEIQKGKVEDDNNLHENLLEIREILKENEFFDDFISLLIENIKEGMSYTKLDDRTEVHKFTYDFIKEQLIFSEDFHLHKGKKNVIVLIGPTGVGKTTTVAKIAANAIKEKLNVDLISIDGYRLGAKDQLQKYADIMGINMSGVEDNLKLQKIVDLSSADIILIDTIGRSTKDEMNLVKMKQLLNLKRCEPKYILTVSATTKPKDVKKIFKSFEHFDYNDVIITKLDESDTIGAILNTTVERKKSIVYYTNGQKVPNDIEKVSAHNVMDKVKGLEIEVYLSSIH